MTIYTYLEAKGKANVSEITHLVKLKQPTVSYHLKEMEKSGLLKSEKSGKEVFYAPNRVCPFDHIVCVLESK